MSNILVSVVIPTYNRAESLKTALNKLADQTFNKDDYEIVIVDDGSTDNTKDVVDEFKESGLKTVYLKQKNQGQGIARNLGVKNSSGKIIIFSQDDIFVGEDFIKGHFSMHLKHSNENEAVLGFIAWDPNMNVTPLMDWLTNGSSILGKFGGHQFAFEKIKHKKTADYNFFYTSNISLKRNILIKHPFDTKFSTYGWEDIELGYRLTKKTNLKINYNPQIIAYHHHKITMKDFKKRMEKIGYSAHIIDKKYPELKKVPGSLKKFIFKILSSSLIIGFFKFFHKRIDSFFSSLYFYAISKKYFLKGLDEFNE